MQINYKDIEAQLSWMCDAMIPGSAELDMPSASKLELITKLLPRALEARLHRVQRTIQNGRYFPVA